MFVAEGLDFIPSLTSFGPSGLKPDSLVITDVLVDIDFVKNMSRPGFGFGGYSAVSFTRSH